MAVVYPLVEKQGKQDVSTTIQSWESFNTCQQQNKIQQNRIKFTTTRFRAKKLRQYIQPPNKEIGAFLSCTAKVRLQKTICI